jgi:hypothetical protein
MAGGKGRARKSQPLGEAAPNAFGVQAAPILRIDRGLTLSVKNVVERWVIDSSGSIFLSGLASSGKKRVEETVVDLARCRLRARASEAKPLHACSFLVELEQLA